MSSDNYHLMIRFQRLALGPEVLMHRFYFIDGEWRLMKTVWAEALDVHVSSLEAQGVYQEIIEEALEKFLTK